MRIERDFFWRFFMGFLLFFFIMDIEEIKTWIQWGIQWGISWIPSGKLSHNYGKPTVFNG